MGSGIYFVHCVVLPSQHITQPMGVNEARLNVDKYDNQIKVSISHQFVVQKDSRLAKVFFHFALNRGN